MNKSFALILIGFMSWITSTCQVLTAKEIVSKADQKSRGLTSQGEMTMTVIRPEWSRTVSMKIWSKGSDYSLILITAPQKENGQAFLKRKTEMWNWVPTIDKLIKIPPSMMLQSWMGSDFTNDDLVKQSSIVTDYEHTLLGKEKVRGADCYKIQLIPLPGAAVVWGKIILWITADGFDQWRTESFDEDMELVTIENAYDIQKMGDRNIPSRIEMEPVNKKGQKTVLTLTHMSYNTPLSDTFFSQQNMKKVR
jgi:outer membrane lipoprotein-sorting protein